MPATQVSVPGSQAPTLLPHERMLPLVHSDASVVVVVVVVWKGAHTSLVTLDPPCSTCCDVDASWCINAVLRSTQPVTEIEVQLIVSQDCPSLEVGSDLDDYFDWGAISFGEVNSDTLRYCLASKNPIEDAIARPFPGRTEGSVASIAIVRAFGADFAPLAGLPTIELE